MKTTTTTTVQLSKEVLKKLAKEKYYTADNFERDANDFVKGIEQGRVICIIGSVASSGMSRTMRFMSFQGSESGYYRNYTMFFEVMGYKCNRDGFFRVSGCGMDMVFATCYNVMHDLKRMGIITAEECERLAQKTPTTI